MLGIRNSEIWLFDDVSKIYVFLFIFLRTQTEIIAEVLDKMGLGSEDMALQEKLDALCLIFKHTITENAQ